VDLERIVSDRGKGVRIWCGDRHGNSRVADAGVEPGIEQVDHGVREQDGVQ
jgi:hypothetical protein